MSPFPEKMAGPTDCMDEVDGQMVELGLLLTRGLATRLEVAARQQGWTVGQMVRHMLRDYLIHRPGPQPADDGVR